MFTICLKVQGLTFPVSVEDVARSLEPLADIKSIVVDWESKRVQIKREINKSSDLIHLMTQAGFSADLDLGDSEDA